MQWELDILNYMQSGRTPFFDAVLPYYTALCELGIFCWWVAVVLLAHYKTRREGLAVLVSCLLEALCCDVILKHVVARPRPFTVNPVELIIKPPSGYSFTSGHTGLSFAMFAALYFSTKKRRFFVPALCFAIVMGFSRMYLYAHYPTDVLGGILLGILCGRGGAMLTDYCLARWNKYQAKKRPKKHFLD